MNKPTVLFVCTGNAGRSQMAEALFRSGVGDRAMIKSAGVEPWRALHPMAVRVMEERDVSLEGHFPKGVASMAGETFDLVVTIGEPAERKTPAALTGGRRIHWDIPDPADADGTPESLEVFRQTAAEIEKRLGSLAGLLPDRQDRTELG